jgi:hypothetical protein
MAQPTGAFRDRRGTWWETLRYPTLWSMVYVRLLMKRRGS